mgnify:CR=1 FL=1
MSFEILTEGLWNLESTHFKIGWGIIFEVISLKTIAPLTTVLETKFGSNFSSPSNNKLSQSEIDQIFNTKAESVLPKGLQENTLNYIVSKISDLKGKFVDIEDISELTNLSKVSLRKYLDYLIELGGISKRIEYGEVGRPKYKYHIK